jgi:hypothetical protein
MLREKIGIFVRLVGCFLLDDYRSHRGDLLARDLPSAPGVTVSIHVKLLKHRPVVRALPSVRDLYHGYPSIRSEILSG